MLYSGGSTQLYRKLVVCHYATYCTGAVLSTTSASVLYVSVSISAPFHISAAFVAIVFCLYAAFFTRRIGRTKSGFQAVSRQPSSRSAARSAARPVGVSTRGRCKAAELKMSSGNYRTPTSEEALPLTPPTHHSSFIIISSCECV